MVDGQELSVERILESPATPEVPRGWVALTSNFFSAITPDNDLTSFFNGGEPSWEAVVNPRLARLELTHSLLERTRRRIREKKAGIELLIGPTGEGKSTALRQAAAALAQEDSRTILWRQHRDALFDQNVLDTALALGPGTVLLSDSAQLILDQLHELIKGGSISSSSGVQMLLASRDTDWTRRTRELGFKLNPADAWKSMGPIVATKHPFGRVTDKDARNVIRSWRSLESNPPSAIQGLSERDAAKLLSDASASASSQHGALLGGLLAIRYTPEELRGHLVSLLESLSQDTIGGEMTLADVVVVLALVDVAGVDGIPSEIIAEFCDIDESDFRSQVANRLGQEAVANYSDDIVRSRHPTISESIFEIAMSYDSGIATESIASRLIAVVQRVGTEREFKGGYGHISGLGRELYKAKVPASLGPKSRSLGIALARRACEIKRTVLSSHMSLSECLRLEKQAEKAIVTVWIPIAGKLLDKSNWEDWNKNSRTAINEFAITASLAHDELEAAILRMAALSDNYRANKLEKQQAVFTLGGLAIHLSRLYDENQEPWLADTLTEIHECILACFPEEVHNVTTMQGRNSTRFGPKTFRTPTAFVLRLNDALARMCSFESEYLDIELWSSRISFKGLEHLLTRICDERNA